MDIARISAGWTAERVDGLRRKLSEAGLTGLVVPRWDAHQSESVLPRDERLAWATGFTGTWGLALITLDRAALFVDGRYAVQARREVDGSVFEVRDLHHEPPEGWLRMHAAGDRIGFDPMVLDPATHATIADALTEAGGFLVAVCSNPLDAAWSDRPEAGPGPIRAFPFRLAGETSRAKRSRLAERLRREKLDLLVDTQPDNVAWLLNLRADDVPYLPAPQASMIIDADGGVELFVAADLLPADDGSELADVEVRPASELLERVRIRAFDGCRVGVDPRFAPVGAALAAAEAGGKAIVTPSPLTALKAVKNGVELAGMREACRRDAVAWVRFLAWLDQGAAQRWYGKAVTELDAEQAILAFRREIDRFAGPSFRTISATGANAALCHYAAPAEGGSALSVDELYLIDSGGQYEDGTTDVTRTVCLSPPAEHLRRIFTLVLKGHIALARQRFPAGTRGYQLDVLARSALWAAHLDYPHGTGHGVGHFLSVHEHPQRIGKEPLAVALEPGMIMTIEPGHYVTGQYGIRIEDMYEIVGEADGWMRFEPITSVPICRALVDPALLDEGERRWVDAYGERTRAALADAALDPAERDWFLEATAPLEARPL